MTRVAYQKPPLSYEDQLQKLKDRGLHIEDRDKALHLLQRLNYYRLSAYWYPFLKEPKTDHLFKEGATFNKAFRLYRFDRELRLLLLREIEKIEVALRSSMAYELSHKYGPHWFQEASLFYRQDIFRKTLRSINKNLNNSDEEFILNFKRKYTDVYPPSWMTLEVVSFGVLSKLFKNLKHSKDKKMVSAHFGVSYVPFVSWVHSIAYVRNICAHHSRLWNKKLRINPAFPRHLSKPWIDETDIENNRVYYFLSLMYYLLLQVNPKTTFRSKLDELITEYPSVHLYAMGFPENWREQPLWMQ